MPKAHYSRHHSNENIKTNCNLHLYDINYLHVFLFNAVKILGCCDLERKGFMSSVDDKCSLYVRHA